MRSAALLLGALVLGGPASASLDAQTLEELTGDTVLARLVDEALEGNPDLRAVEARIRGARARRFDAVLDLAPTVTAAGGYTRQRIAGASLAGPLPDRGLWEAGVQASWEVDAFGRVRRSVEGRTALLDAAEEDTRDVRLLLTAEVAGAYFRLRGAQDRLAVARLNAENQRRTLAVTQERLSAGRGTALDTERARAQLSSTRAAIPALDASMAAERHRIAVLLGRDPSDLTDELGSEAPPLRLPPEIPLSEPGSLARRRPDVQGAERRLAASTAFVGAAKAEYLPRISIQAAAGYTAVAFDALGSSGTPRYAVGPVISWPLLDLARVKSGVDGARADEAEARARYESTLLSAREELETSLVAYRTARERLQHLEDAAAASARATELAQLRFEEGASDFLEVLDAERRLLEAQDRLAQGRTEAAMALVAVYRAGLGQNP